MTALINTHRFQGRYRHRFRKKIGLREKVKKFGSDRVKDEKKTKSEVELSDDRGEGGWCNAEMEVYCGLLYTEQPEPDKETDELKKKKQKKKKTHLSG